MKRQMTVAYLIALAAMLITSTAHATNGDILIGIGKERGMGGAGIAAVPQDAAGGILLNPAGIALLDDTLIDVGGTLFLPTVNARANLGAGATTTQSEANYFIVPTVGFALPVVDWCSVGLAFYGISGMGVDYVNKNVGNTAAFAAMPAPYNQFVGALDFKTTKQLFQFAPTVAFQFLDNKLAFGVSPIINYGMLDFGQGLQQTLGFGAKVGVRWQIVKWLSFGATYKSMSPMKYSRVYDFEGDGTRDSLKLDQPQQVGWGFAITPIENLLIVLDGKWINWSGAKGYKDFGWRDQYIAAAGGQYQINKYVTVRAGYNYGRNPIRNESGFASGTSIGTGTDTRRVQGHLLNGGEAGEFAYQAFRSMAFPAIVEHHLTLGVTVDFNEHYAATLSYMHAFEKAFDESGTLDGAPVNIGSTLAEDTVTVLFHFAF